MALHRNGADRGALTGAIISGIFGIGWAEWGASGLSGNPSKAVRIVGIVFGVIIIARSARLRRSAPSRSESMFASRGYRLVVVGEVVAIAVGAAILSATGHSGYVCAWVAAVVGVHFLAFAHLFDPFFGWLGGALIIASVAGTAVGVAAGGGTDRVEATTGLIAAASLFAAAGWRLLSGARPAGTVS